MEVSKHDAATTNEWPVCTRDRERLEYVAERIYDAREVLRKILAGEPLKKDQVANATLDLTSAMLTLRELGVPIPASD